MAAIETQDAPKRTRNTKPSRVAIEQRESTMWMDIEQVPALADTKAALDWLKANRKTGVYRVVAIKREVTLKTTTVEKTLFE